MKVAASPSRPWTETCAETETNLYSGFKKRFGASSIGGTRVSNFAFQPSNPPPMPIMPTLATLPSNKAFVACVVECAIKTTLSGEISSSLNARLIASIMPSATPSFAE